MESSLKSDRCKIVCEIGINANGSMDIAKQLIKGAADAGADAVKFQKRTVEKVYSKEELDKPRESPWGTTNREQKLALEFGQDEYEQIDAYCKQVGIEWFASPWDVDSVQFLEQFDPPYHKVASALITDKELLGAIKATGRKVILSTGMSTLEEISRAVRFLTSMDRLPEPVTYAQLEVEEEAARKNITLLHCHSAYPSPVEELNLNCISTLRERYNCPVGYSGHETGLATTLAAVAMGACMIERHITLDRTMYGSDQAASVELAGFKKLCRDIRSIESAMGDGVKRVWESELPARNKLRKA